MLVPVAAPVPLAVVIVKKMVAVDVVAVPVVDPPLAWWVLKVGRLLAAAVVPTMKLPVVV